MEAAISAVRELNLDTGVKFQLFPRAVVVYGVSSEETS